METKKILVTGGAGFMGSWLVDDLIDKGHDVVSVDNLLGGKRENVNPDCEFVHVDVRQRNKVSPLMKGIEIVFHLAAYAAEGQSLFSPVAINEINIVPMNNLLVEAANSSDLERFVFTSSMAVYGNQISPFNEDFPRRPEDPYGAAKAYCESMLEIFARNYDFEYVILRPHNVYGPRQNIADPFRNVLGIWINRVLRGKPPLIYGDGGQKRAFSYVADVTPAIAGSGFSEESQGQIINVGSDEVVSIQDACDILLGLMGSELRPVHQPPRPAEVREAYCTIEKSVRLIGYETRHTLKEGLPKMIQWARRTGPQEPTYTVPLEITRKAPTVWLKKAM